MFKELIQVGLSDKAYDTDHNLFTACFVTINTLIEYSSHDVQDKLEEIIAYLLGLAQNANGLRDADRIKDLHSSIALLLYYIISKSVKRIKFNVASQIYSTLVETFKLRQGIYDEAMLAISALSLSKNKH